MGNISEMVAETSEKAMKVTLAKYCFRVTADNAGGRKDTDRHSNLTGFA